MTTVCCDGARFPGDELSVLPSTDLLGMVSSATFNFHAGGARPRPNRIPKSMSNLPQKPYASFGSSCGVFARSRAILYGGVSVIACGICDLHDAVGDW